MYRYTSKYMSSFDAIATVRWAVVSCFGTYAGNEQDAIPADGVKALVHTGFAAGRQVLRKHVGLSVGSWLPSTLLAVS